MNDSDNSRQLQIERPGSVHVPIDLRDRQAFPIWRSGGVIDKMSIVDTC